MSTRHVYNENDMKTKLALQSEDLVLNCFTANTIKARKSTKDENYTKHTDIFIIDDDKEISVDVKRKKSSFICVELELGYYDNNKQLFWRPGWLYSKDLEVLAFHLYDTNEIILVTRKKLVKLVESNNFNIFGRKEYKEKLVIVPYDDLKRISIITYEV